MRLCLLLGIISSCLCLSTVAREPLDDIIQFDYEHLPAEVWKSSNGKYYLKIFTYSPNEVHVFQISKLSHLDNCPCHYGFYPDD